MARPLNPRLVEYMRRYGLTKQQVRNLGGVDRLDAMSEEARQLLANMCVRMPQRKVGP